MISIIIPVYNGEKSISNTIESILGQSYSKFELIIVDDGSTDKTLSVIEQYKDQRIKVVQQVNARQGAARNNGLKHATGEFVVFIDADDEISNNLLEEIDEEINRDPSLDIIYYDILRLYGNGKKELVPFDQSLITKVNSNLSSKILGAATPCDAAFRRDFLELNNILFLEKVYFEDISFMVDTLQKARSISYVSNVHYQYNIVENSTVRSTDSIVNLDILKNFDHLLQNSTLKTDYSVELEFLAIKYILFEGSLRTLNSKSSNDAKVFQDITQYYRKHFNNPLNNLYVKNESSIFKIIIKTSYKSKTHVLKAVNFLRRIIK